MPLIYEATFEDDDGSDDGRLRYQFQLEADSFTEAVDLIPQQDWCTDIAFLVKLELVGGFL